jgi:antitoxin component of MazEF toxin-antitoxin module
MSMREIVKVRLVAGSAVISLPQSVLEPVGLKAGDRVIVEAAPPRRLIITKEGASMSSTQRLELEVDLLEKKKTAINSDLKYKERQYNSSMPVDEGMSDSSVAVLTMSSLVCDRDRLTAEIAEKKLELYDLLGGDERESRPGEPESDLETPPARAAQTTHAEQILRAAATLAGSDRTGIFSRKQVREQLGLTPHEWQSGFTAIFQSMRDDHPGGAPQVSAKYKDLFHRLGSGRYQLSARGRRLAHESSA